MQLELFWDATYAIVQAIIDHHPQLKPNEIGLNELENLVLNLPGFCDDKELVTEQILLDILTEWLEF